MPWKYTIDRNLIILLLYRFYKFLHLPFSQSQLCHCKITPLMVQCWWYNVIRDKVNFGILGKKSQMIERDTWKVIESLQVHISYKRSLDSIGKVIPGFSCVMLGYFWHWINFRGVGLSVLKSSEFFIVTFLLYEAWNCFWGQAQWITLIKWVMRYFRISS